MLPALAPNPCIGVYEGSIPVYAAIGDNQASFLGATGGDRACMLVNVGTGSQFSVFSPDYLSCPGLETRPFPGGYLIVGASLCGGRAYALLERFLASAAEVVTGVPADSCYEAMDRALSRGEKPDNLPNLTPLFQGTRENPALRGSITGLDPENFTFPHLIWAMLEGMAEELHAMYLRYIDCSHKTARLVGSGNGLRKNKHLQASFSRCFGQPLQMSDCLEEAAVGATLYAAIHQAQ